MKILKAISLMMLMMCFSVTMVQAQTLAKVDPSSSTINWEGKKVTGAHNGTIKVKEGQLTFSEGKLTGGSFTMDMTTIACADLSGKGAEKLVGHLKSDDFFGVASHPAANLVISNVAATADGYDITGDLTIKGITKPISFTATAGQYLANAKITIDRTAYDIKYGSGSFFDNLGDKAIHNDFTIDANLVLVVAQ